MPICRYIALVLCALSAAGCVGGRNWNPFGEVAAPALSPHATCEQVVAHLNSNIERCTGWRSTNVSIKSDQVMLGATGMIAVESPRRFRMLVKAFIADLADLGSNDERLWFWMRPMADQPSYVMTCSHEDLPVAQQRMPVPFRPDWLMEVLGVIPIDPSTVELEPNPGDAGEFLLVSHQTAPDGTPVRRVMTVDATRGVIVNHTLWNVSADGAQLIAQARLSDHRRDERTGVTLPHKIELTYVDANATLTLAIKSIEVNPTGVAATTWTPGIAGTYPCRDMATGQLVSIEQDRAY